MRRKKVQPSRVGGKNVSQCVASARPAAKSKLLHAAARPKEKKAAQAAHCNKKITQREADTMKRFKAAEAKLRAEVEAQKRAAEEIAVRNKFMEMAKADEAKLQAEIDAEKEERLRAEVECEKALWKQKEQDALRVFLEQAHEEAKAEAEIDAEREAKLHAAVEEQELALQAFREYAKAEWIKLQAERKVERDADESVGKGCTHETRN